MKRFLILLLIVALCFSGCKKKSADISGQETTPDGVDWRVWDTYTSATLTMGEETVQVLMGLDAIHLVIYYDKQEQEELTTITIIEPLSDVTYSQGHLRVADQNQDGYDDICIPDVLENGDRVMNWWLWDPLEERYRYDSESSETEAEIGGDITWMAGRNFVNGSMDTPDGSQDLLILVEDMQILVYLDEREEILWGTAQIPQNMEGLTQEDLQQWAYWECWDLNGDEWGDLQIPYRWEEVGDGTIYQYNYCWMWDPESEIYTFDADASRQPVF